MVEDDESIIANFVRDNQSLFVVMGIFAAISIYITQISSYQGVSESDKYYLGFGVAASLFLFITLCWIILSEMHRSRKPSKRPFLLDIHNLEYALFVIPFLTVAITIIYFVAKTLPKQISAIMVIINYMLGMFIFIYILEKVLIKKGYSLRWSMITSGLIVIIIPIIHIIFNQYRFYQMNSLFIMPIFSSMITGSIISLFISFFLFINKKFGFSKWILERIKYS